MTTPDFQTQLRVQLRDAARREERRSAPARWVGALPRVSPAMALAAVALIALAVVLGLSLRGTAPDREAAPSKVERFSVTPTLGPILNAFGSVWVEDPTGHLLRVNPRTREVLGSVDIPPRALLGAAAGSLWVGDPDDGTAIRLDPKTGDVVGRIPLRTPSGDEFVVGGIAFGDRLAWAAGTDGLLRLDLERNVSDRVVRLNTAGLVRGMVLDDGALWVLARNNRLLRLDPRTGARRGSVALSWQDSVALGAEHGVPIEWSPLTGHIARVDLSTGKELWATELHGHINYWTVVGPDIWVHVSDGSPKDHVVRLDARTGKALQKVQLPDLGVTTMAAVDGRLWVATLNGQIDVVKPAARG
jgi:outer membrane protein assembly factor BamB